MYYRVVVIGAPLQGLCYTERDAVDWCHTPTTRWFWKGSNHALCSFVDQLNTARRFMWNKVTKAKCPVDTASQLYRWRFCYDLHRLSIDVAKDKYDCFILNSEGVALADELHSPITTIPGIGCRVGAMILSKVGDSSRFDSPDELLAYAEMSSLYLPIRTA